MKALLIFSLLLCASCAPPSDMRAGSEQDSGKACEPQKPMPPIPQSAPANSTYLSTDLPPDHYKNGDVTLEVEFVSPEEANRLCASQPSGKPVCGLVFFACVHGDKLIAPNPCLTHGEKFADLMCHEAAHRRGWPATHGDYHDPQAPEQDHPSLHL